MSRLGEALDAFDKGYIDDKELAKISLEEGAISQEEYSSKIGTATLPKPTESVVPKPEPVKPTSLGASRGITAIPKEGIFDPEKETENAFNMFVRKTFDESSRKVKAVGAGAASAVKSGASGLKMAAKLEQFSPENNTSMLSVLKSMGLNTLGEAVRSKAAEVEKTLTPKDPTFADQIAMAGGSSLPGLLPGFGVFRGAQALGGVAQRLAPWLGATASATVEAMTNAGQAYERGIEKGMKPEEAAKRGAGVFWTNIPLNAVLDRFGFMGKGGPIGKALASAANEGLQEPSQYVIGNLMVNDPVFMEEIIRSGILGASTGGLMGGTIGTYESLNPIDIAERSGLPKESVIEEQRQKLGQIINDIETRPVDGSDIVELDKRLKANVAEGVTVVRPETGQETKLGIGESLPASQEPPKTPSNIVETPVSEPLQGEIQPDAVSATSGISDVQKVPSGGTISTQNIPDTQEIPPIPTAQEGPEPNVTSNKNAQVDSERIAEGLKELPKPEPITNEETWEKAKVKIQENPRIQQELILELTENPRTISDVENAILLHKREQLKLEMEASRKRWKEAFESGNQSLAEEESKRKMVLLNERSDLDQVTKSVGTELGRAFQARKMAVDDDFELTSMELDSMEAKGRELTPKEQMDISKAHKEIQDLSKQLEKKAGEFEERAVKDALETVKRTAKEKTVEEDKDRAINSIAKKLKKGDIYDITADVQDLARYLWTKGIRQRDTMINALHEILKTIEPEITKNEVQRAFSGYGDYKQISKEEIDIGIRDLKGQTQQVLKMEALEAKKALEKTGVERRSPSDEERRLIKQVNELKRKYGVKTTDPQTQLKSALESRKTYYQHRISDLKHEIEAKEKTVKTQTPSPVDAELLKLKAEYEQVKAEHDSIFGTELSPEKKLELAIKAAERNQEQWNQKLANAKKGVFEAKTKQTVTSLELQKIQAKTEEIKTEVKLLKDLANPKKSPEEIALQSLKKRMASKTVEYTERLSKGEFVRVKKAPVTLDSEGQKIKAELELAKNKFKQGLENDRWARAPIFTKVTKTGAGLYDAARLLMTTGEFSFVLRQGKWYAMSHPIKTLKTVKDAFKAFFSSDINYRALENQVLDDPDINAALNAKLHLTRTDSPISKQEEMFIGKFTDKIPLVRRFNQAGVVFLNKIRLDLWKSMRKSMSLSGTPTLEEDKQIAMAVNESTGRGSLGRTLEPGAVPLSRLFFSLRYMVSRFQLAAGHSLWGGTARTRKVIAMEYARSLIGYLVYSNLIALYLSQYDEVEKEKDMTSSDWGKIVLRDTRLDLMAGLSQVAVLAARSLTGEKKTLKGKTVPIRGEKVPYGDQRWSGVAGQFVRSKMHPIPSAIINLFDGTNLIGEEAKVESEASKMVRPMTYVDIYEALKEHGLSESVALGLLAFLGEGLSTYDKK